MADLPARDVLAAYAAHPATTERRRKNDRGWRGLGHLPTPRPHISADDRARAIRAAQALGHEFGGRWLAHSEAHEWAAALRFTQWPNTRGQVWAELAATHPAAVQRTARRIRFAPTSDPAWAAVLRPTH